MRSSQEGVGDFRESTANTIHTEQVRPKKEPVAFVLKKVVGRNQWDDPSKIQTNYYDEDNDDLDQNLGQSKQKFDIRKQISQLNNSAMSKFDGVPKFLLNQPMILNTPLQKSHSVSSTFGSRNSLTYQK